MFLCVETCRNPFEVPQEPTVLNDSSANLMTFACGTVQEPILGSTGTDRFERQFYEFDDFCLLPRALFIILNKARGGPLEAPGRSFV